MSKINGKTADDWIIQNRPETGWFRVYWKDVITYLEGGVTLDPVEGEGLRYEWEYKDGHRADGVSKSWYPNGQLKEERTYKNGKQDGLHISWFENGQKMFEGTYKNGELDGLLTYWYEDGQKRPEITYKDGTHITKKFWSIDGK